MIGDYFDQYSEMGIEMGINMGEEMVEGKVNDLISNLVDKFTNPLKHESFISKKFNFFPELLAKIKSVTRKKADEFKNDLIGEYNLFHIVEEKGEKKMKEHRRLYANKIMIKGKIGDEIIAEIEQYLNMNDIQKLFSRFNIIIKGNIDAEEKDKLINKAKKMFSCVRMNYDDIYSKEEDDEDVILKFGSYLFEDLFFWVGDLEDEKEDEIKKLPHCIWYCTNNLDENELEEISKKYDESIRALPVLVVVMKNEVEERVVLNNEKLKNLEICYVSIDNDIDFDSSFKNLVTETLINKLKVFFEEETSKKFKEIKSNIIERINSFASGMDLNSLLLLNNQMIQVILRKVLTEKNYKNNKDELNTSYKHLVEKYYKEFFESEKETIYWKYINKLTEEICDYYQEQIASRSTGFSSKNDMQSKYKIIFLNEIDQNIIKFMYDSSFFKEKKEKKEEKKKNENIKKVDKAKSFCREMEVIYNDLLLKITSLFINEGIIDNLHGCVLGVYLELAHFPIKIGNEIKEVRSLIMEKVENFK